ncbi:MAG: TauD/TfdA family dioxygenase [Sphingomonadaceae bacterium]|nr:TauD/TfdA family dioxygenase [Sphingomonadaceae bacterium]
MIQTGENSQTSRRLEQAQQDFDGPVHLSQPYPGAPPLWIEPTDTKLRTSIEAAAEWMSRNHDAIERALLSFGGVFWRGFPAAGTDDFIQLMERFEPYSKGYSGGTSDRKAIKGQAMEATRTPPHVYIQLHQEMSYMPSNPRALAFYCKQPSATGGETVLCDMRGLLEEIPQDLRRKFEEYGAEYVRNLRSADVDDFRARPELRHPSWQYRFETDDRDDVSSQLAERGAQCDWHDDGSLTFCTRTPAITVHPQTGDRLYFNQLNSQIQNTYTIGEEREALLQEHYDDTLNRPFAVRFGNGDPFTDEEYLIVHEIFEARKIVFPWQAGDIMLLENKLTAHGRHPFTGERDVQVMIFD